MKNIKYIVMALAVLSLASCGKYKWNWNIDHNVDQSTACFQLFKVVPETTTAANYTYQVMFNSDTIKNNASSLITTYNGIPSGSADRWYNYPAGTLALKMYKGSAKTLCYESNVTLSAGDQTVWVYSYDAEPIVIKETAAPSNLSTTNDTIAGVAKKYYNFLFDNGVPCKFKIQLYEMPTQYTGSDMTKYEKVGEPIGFGECTDWFISYVKKTTFNASGSATRYMSFKRVDYDEATGQWKEGDWLTYSNSKGVATVFNDYWTEYWGRAVRRFARGDVSSKTVTMAVSNMYAR